MSSPSSWGRKEGPDGTEIQDLQGWRRVPKLSGYSSLNAGGSDEFATLDDRTTRLRLLDPKRKPYLEV